MNLSEILKRIKPCDMEQPYIFVSYSSEDSEVVWRDVWELQKRGYNIWIDKKHVDKKKDGWTDDALEAIKDMDCELVLFYVSKSSLVSEPCYRELLTTMEEDTVNLHNESVKTMVIDAERIEKFSVFMDSLHESIRRNSGINKNDKKDMLNILSSFKKKIFLKIDEKARVFSRDTFLSDEEYYEEIVSSLPEVTKNSDVQEGQTSDVYENIDKEKVEYEDVTCNDELIKLQYELELSREKERHYMHKIIVLEAEIAQLKRSIEYLQRKRELSEEFKKRIDRIVKESNYPDHSRIRYAILEANKVGTEAENILIPEMMSEENILTAIRSYAQNCKVSEVLGILPFITADAISLWERGFLVTAKGLYSSFFPDKKAIELQSIESIQSGMYPNNIKIIYKDGTQDGLFVPGRWSKTIKTFLTALVESEKPVYPEYL